MATKKQAEATRDSALPILRTGRGIPSRRSVVRLPRPQIDKGVGLVLAIAPMDSDAALPNRLIERTTMDPEPGICAFPPCEQPGIEKDSKVGWLCAEHSARARAVVEKVSAMTEEEWPAYLKGLLDANPQFTTAEKAAIAQMLEKKPRLT